MSKVQSDAKPFNAPTTYSARLTVDNEIVGQEAITVIEENVKLFVERQDLLQDSFEYPRNSEDPGLVLVFNQEYFEDKSYRVGSRRDVNEIITCMSRLGYNISKKNIFSDLTRKGISKTLNEIADMDLSQFNCLIVFFLSHGDSFNHVFASDGVISANELWKCFALCPGLMNKPKMFIFQACKGDNFSTTADNLSRNDHHELVPEQTFQSEYLGSDMLIVYSATEGNVSFRDPKTGTWFIQELLKNFTAYGRREDVVSLLMRTNKCICGNYYNIEQDQLKKQSPVFISTLRKKFYLNRSKERNCIIYTLQELENLKQRVEDLEAAVKELVVDKQKRQK